MAKDADFDLSVVDSEQPKETIAGNLRRLESAYENLADQSRRLDTIARRICGPLPGATGCASAAKSPDEDSILSETRIISSRIDERIADVRLALDCIEETMGG